LNDWKGKILGACILLVVLRIAIGWQFLYEGLWKIQTQSTAKPWTSAGYLRNARGPLRKVFRGMTGDADQQNWLNAEWVTTRWETWQSHFVSHHGLNKQQVRRLDVLLNGPKDFRAALKALPQGVKFRGTLAKRLKFQAETGRLIIDGRFHLTPRERDAALALAPIEENPPPERREGNDAARKYQAALKIAFARASRLSFKERLRASLLGDPDRSGLTIRKRGSDVPMEIRLGEIELYRKQLARYEQDLAAAETGFQHDHVGQLAVPGFGNTIEIRTSLIGPIRGLEQELVDAAEKLLTDEQRLRGPIKMPATRIDQIDALTMWSLTVLGALLILGLCSRVAAVGGAGLLLMFYLAMPPWPGVPPAPGPEHSLWVNKNLIEIIALLALAFLPTGRWFGIDALVGHLPLKLKTRTTADSTTTEDDSSPEETRAADQEPAETEESDAVQTDGDVVDVDHSNETDDKPKPE
jgi:uncharacterized membrane protein YphA (DoxX/SURF4 family)